MKLRTDLNTSKLSLTLSKKRYDFLGGGEKVLGTIYDGYKFIGVSPDKSFLYEKDGSYFTEAGNFSKKQRTQTVSADVHVKREPRAEIELVKINDINYDPSMFVPMKTGDVIDYMFSTDGGIFPSTNYIIIGDPGIGKSTQTLDILAKIVKEDPTKKVLFVSGEMNQIDMYGYVQRYPEFGNIPTLFLSDYVDDDPIEVLESVYNQGFDIILIDSFVEVPWFRRPEEPLARWRGALEWPCGPCVPRWHRCIQASGNPKRGGRVWLRSPFQQSPWRSWVPRPRPCAPHVPGTATGCGA